MTDYKRFATDVCRDAEGNLYSFGVRISADTFEMWVDFDDLSNYLCNMLDNSYLLGDDFGGGAHIATFDGKKYISMDYFSKIIKKYIDDNKNYIIKVQSTNEDLAMFIDELRRFQIDEYKYMLSNTSEEADRYLNR